MKHPNKGHRQAIIAGLGWMYLSAALQGLSKLVVIAILARLLNPRDFGLIGIALIFTSLAERLGQIGIGPALIQRSAIDGDDIVTGSVLSICCGCVMAAVLWVSAPAIAGFFREPLVSLIIRVLSIGFLIDGLAVTSDSLLQRSLAFRTMMVVENAAYIIGIGAVGAALALCGLGVWALVVGHIAMRTIRAGMLYHYAPRVEGQGRFNRSRVGGLLYLGGGFSLGRILNFASLQGDNFVIGRMLGMDALGIYSRAYQLMALPAVYVAQVLERVLFPVLAKRQDDKSKVREAFLTVLELLALVSLPLGVFLLFSAGPLVEAIFGPRWGAIAPILSILSFGVFFRTAYKCSDTVVRSLGEVYRYAVQQGVYALCIVLGSVLGAQLGGAAGVAVGVVAAVAVNYALMTRLSARLLAVPLRELILAHALGAWAASWLAAALALSQGIISSGLEGAWAQLAAYAAVAVGACGASAWVGAQVLPSRTLAVVLPQVAALGARWGKRAHV